MSKLLVQPSPSSACPYRCEVPPGVWAAEEYEKLRGFDDNTEFGTFLCHHTPAIGQKTVCRGWLTVHAESVAVRLAVARGLVTDDERYGLVWEPLYGSGNEAADAGLSGVAEPEEAAQRMMARLVRQRER